MIITRIQLKNWMNFTNVNVPLGPRTCVIGANASGKSNFMEVFRFLRTLTQANGGGLQKAVKERRGLGKIRSLHARKDPAVRIEVELLEESDSKNIKWLYSIEMKSEGKGLQRTIVSEESICKNGKIILKRPQDEDHQDPERLTQTHLEQINLNKDFRTIVDFFSRTTYLHLVPQLLKHGDSLATRVLENDPFGQGLLQRIAATPKKVRDSRLKRISDSLEKAVPLFSSLRFDQDKITGLWHLEANFNHWRVNGAWQREDQFSDGTLRLIGLLWSLQDGEGLLLLEEPELSLNDGIIERIPLLIDRVLRYRKKGLLSRQVLISTHSEVLLREINEPEQILLITPKREGSEIRPPTSDELNQMRSGLNPSEILLPKTRPTGLESIGL